MNKADLTKLIKSLIKESYEEENKDGMLANLGKYNNFEDDDDFDLNDEESKIESKPNISDDLDLVKDKVTGKFVPRKELNPDVSDEPTEMMKKYSPFRVKESHLKKIISDIIKEMTGTASLAIGGGSGLDTENQTKKAAMPKLRKHNSAFAKRKQKPTVEKEREEKKKEEIKEVRKIIRSIIKEMKK